MTIDENTRLDLRQWFERQMGERLARAVMEAMPPIDYDQLATKADVDLLGRELRAEMRELRGELRAEMSEVRAEMSQLRADTTSLEGRLDLKISEQTRLLVTMQITTIAATVASMIGLASLLG